MYNYITVIKEIAEKSNITNKQLAAYAGMTEAGFYKAIKNKTLKLETAIEICSKLNVSPTVLFSKQIAQDQIVNEGSDYSEKKTLLLILLTLNRIHEQQEVYMEKSAKMWKENNEILKKLLKGMNLRNDLIRLLKDDLIAP